MPDLNDAEDVARYLATDPADHKHERALDELTDAFGFDRAMKIYARGVAIVTGDDQ